MPEFDINSKEQKKQTLRLKDHDFPKKSCQKFTSTE